MMGMRLPPPATAAPAMSAAAYGGTSMPMQDWLGSGAVTCTFTVLPAMWTNGVAALAAPAPATEMPAAAVAATAKPAAAFFRLVMGSSLKGALKTVVSLTESLSGL